MHETHKMSTNNHRITRPQKMLEKQEQNVPKQRTRGANSRYILVCGVLKLRCEIHVSFFNIKQQLDF